jgi:hypothetical protein
MTIRENTKIISSFTQKDGGMKEREGSYKSSEWSIK